MNEMEQDLHQTTPHVAEPIHGRYRFLRQHAQGGLGKISIALDVELNREIAHKSIRDEHSASPFHQEKFAQEALVTGALEHPGVVPVYGFGSDHNGNLFYAMRFIRGEELSSRIKSFHRRVHDKKEALLGTELRFLIRELIDVCHTIAYAHSRGVVHRDLKPANIMLGPYGETLVVDWGLAKPLGNAIETKAGSVASESPPQAKWVVPVSVSKSGTADTQDGQIIGTPLYAAPEQLLGQVSEIDHRSDIYSLGVILFEILIGGPPMADKPLADFVTSVLKGLTPSPRQICVSIPRSIDAICRKAMSLDKRQRYQSVAELRLDLERWLDGQPVSVYRETFGERSIRWMRDHSTLVRTASLSMAVITIVSLIAAYNIRQAHVQQRNAKNEATQLLHIARAATEQLVRETRDGLDDLPGTTEIRGKLLASAAESFKKIAAVKNADVDLLRESASAFVGLASVQRQLDQRESAIESLKNAVKTFENVLGSGKADDEVLVSLADAQVELSRVLSDDPDDESTALAIEQAFKSIREFDEHSSHAVRQKLVEGQALVQKAVIASDLKDYRRAIEINSDASKVIEEGLSMVNRDSQQEQWQAPLRLELARSLMNEAHSRAQENTHDPEIQSLNRSAIQQLEWIIKKFPSNKEAIENYALALNNQAQFDIDNSNFQAAAEGYQSALAYSQRLQAEQPGELEYRNLTILALIGLGVAAKSKGDDKAALNYFQQAFELSEELLKLNAVSIRFRESYDLAADQYFQMLVHELRYDEPDGLTARLDVFLSAAEAFRNEHTLYNAACIISKACSVLTAQGNNLEREINDYLNRGWSLLNRAVSIDYQLYPVAKEDKDLELLRQVKAAEFLKMQPHP